MDTMDLTLEQLPPKDLNIVDCEEVPDYIKWFDETNYGNKFGWKIKHYEDKCSACGSPFCLYKKIQKQ